MKAFRQIYAVFLKDLKSEFKTRYAISAFTLFIVTSIIMIIFATRGEQLSDSIAAGLLWTIMFFGAMTSLSKSFVSEYERETMLYLTLSTNSSAIYFGKLLFNIILSIALNYLAVLLFFIFNDDVEIVRFGELILLIFLGSLALAGSTTIISAIISKAQSKNALFPVLSFPVLIPAIILGIELTKHCLSQSANINAISYYNMLLAYTGLMITGSYYLFDIIRKD